MPNNSNAISTELVDIEPPVFLDVSSLQWEGIAWLDTTIFALILLFGIIGFIGLIIWRSRLYRSAYLYWKLMQITPKNRHPNKLTIPRQQAYRLYQYCLEMQSMSPTTPLLKADLSRLIEQITPLCFSKEEVSRETYLSLLSHAKRQLKQRLKSSLRSRIHPNKKAS